MGTYSCHGVEPSYNDEEGVTAKINQDRGCVVYPLNDDPKHALFSVFDGEDNANTYEESNMPRKQVIDVSLVHYFLLDHI